MIQWPETLDIGDGVPWTRIGPSPSFFRKFPRGMAYTNGTYWVSEVADDDSDDVSKQVLTMQMAARRTLAREADAD